MQTLADEDASPQGALLLIRLHDLAGLNHRFGRDKSDAFIQRCAAELTDLSQANVGRMIGRMNGADFALLLPDTDVGRVRDSAKAVLGGAGQLHQRGFTDDNQPASCGFTLYQKGESSSDVLARADTALLHAERSAERIAANLGDVPSNSPNLDWQIQLHRALAENRWAGHISRFMPMMANCCITNPHCALRDADSAELIPAGLDSAALCIAAGADRRNRSGRYPAGLAGNPAQPACNCRQSIREFAAFGNIPSATAGHAAGGWP